MFKPFAVVATAAMLVAYAAPMQAQTLPPRPPDGTYTYAIAGIPSITQTTIVIRTTPGGFSVIENVSLAGTTVASQTDYDAQTLLPLHYSILAHGTLTDVAFSNGTASLLKTSVTESKPPGTKGLIVSEGLFSVMSMLPAIVASAHGQPISDMVLAGGVSIVTLAPASTADARPSDVPAGDVETALNSSNGQRETFWSNPTTYALDRTDIGSASMTLASYTTATSAIGPQAPPTPMPTALPHFSSRDVSFASTGGAVIAGTLTVPNGRVHRLPAFIFIHGSGAGTRDAAIPANPTFLFLSNALSNNGVVVLRYDKRGIGMSTGTPTEKWHPLGNDARAAIAFLKRQPSVDPHRIFILGHSEGGMIAPLIAPSIPWLAGIVLMAGPAIPLDRVIAEQLPGARNAHERAMLDAGFASYAGLDPAAYITKVNVPILVLQGSRDKNVLARDLPHLVDAARASHRNITVKLLPEDDHLFIRLAADQSADGREELLPAPLDPRVAQDILAWMRSLPTSSR